MTSSNVNVVKKTWYTQSVPNAINLNTTYNVYKLENVYDAAAAKHGESTYPVPNADAPSMAKSSVTVK